MFGNMKDMMGQFQGVQKLMQDENFKAFISHSKVQDLFRDPEFKETAQSKNFQKIMAHPRFSALMRDPELGALLAKIDFKSLLNHGS